MRDALGSHPSWTHCNFSIFNPPRLANVELEPYEDDATTRTSYRPISIERIRDGNL